jgi:hypothetical protein
MLADKKLVVLQEICRLKLNGLKRLETQEIVGILKVF